MRRFSVAIAASSAVHRSGAFQAAAHWRNNRPGFVTSPLGNGGVDSIHRQGARVPRAHFATSSSADGEDATVVSDLPTKEQLSSDPFMKQVSYAADIIPLLSDDGATEDVSELLSAQLSHSDGIRGFFVSYLTGEGTTAADDEVVPVPLREAMAGADADELVPLACMNLIMPTAMVTMHEDPELSASSARTAKRGAKVLGALLETESCTAVLSNCAAIRSVTTGETGKGFDGDLADDKLRYWTEFCDKWGYGPKQLKDIASAVSGFC